LLPALRQLPDKCGPLLMEFVRRGGGLMLFVGEGLSTGRYNAELENLLPARLDRVEGDSPAFDRNWHLRDFDAKSPVFAAFRKPRSGDLTLPRFWGRFAISPVETSQVLARFGDSVPLVVGREIGRGRVMLVNASATTSWSDWPKHKTFVPWLHGACSYLAGRELSTGLQLEKSQVAGSMPELELGADFRQPVARVHPPSGLDFPVTLDAGGRLAFPVETPGIYSVLDTSGQAIRLVAVNPPARESDLTAMTPAEFESQIIRSQSIAQAGPMSGLIDPTDGGRTLWRLLMLAVALFLVLETLLGNHTFA
jgi:hypothetical protein